MSGFYWAVLTAFIWGLVPILEKLGLSKIEPFAGLLLRCGGVLLGAGVLIAVKREHLSQVLKADWKTIVFLVIGGLLASFIGQPANSYRN